MTTDRRSKTVAGRQYPSIVKDDRYVLAADAEVTPGMLLEVVGETEGGKYLEVQPHSEVAGPALTRFAEVRAHPPRGDQTRTLRKEQDYDEPGEMVEVIRFRDGDTSDNLLLADGEDVSAGDPLVSDGEGALQAAAADGSEDAAIICEAEEAVNNTTGEAVRIEVTF